MAAIPSYGDTLANVADSTSGAGRLAMTTAEKASVDAIGGASPSQLTNLATDLATGTRIGKVLTAAKGGVAAATWDVAGLATDTNGDFCIEFHLLIAGTGTGTVSARVNGSKSTGLTFRRRWALSIQATVGSDSTGDLTAGTAAAPNDVLDITVRSIRAKSGRPQRIMWDWTHRQGGNGNAVLFADMSAYYVPSPDAQIDSVGFECGETILISAASSFSQWSSGTPNV